MTKLSLHDQIVEVTNEYLGPAAQRFIDRQILNHLNKEPEDLQIQDLPTLIDWVRVSIAFLTEDRELIDELTQRLRKLQGSKTVGR